VSYTKSLLRKPPTSSSLYGPPMFRKTIAVGPLELVESWVTGGTATVAMDLDFRSPWFANGHIVVAAGLRFEWTRFGTLLESWVKGVRMDMVVVACFPGKKGDVCC
jgi:hypothetical protein